MLHPISFANIDPRNPPFNQLILGMPYEAYHNFDLKRCVRATHIKAALQSLAHYKLALTGESRTTPELRIGTYTHQALFEPQVFAQDVLPHIRQKTEHNLVMTAQAVADAIRAHRRAGPLLLGEGMHHEASVFWHDLATGMRCKARFDAIGVTKEFPDGLIVDLKTCRDSDPDKFARDCGNLVYAIQMMHYIDGARAAGLPTLLDGSFFMVAAEKTPPYGLRVYSMGPWAEHGQNQRDMAMAAIREGQETQEFPCYDEEDHPLGLPGYISMLYANGR